MPYINVKSSKEIKTEEEFLKNLSSLMAREMGKPESYIMTSLETGVKMTFGGEMGKTVFVELKSIGLSENQTEELSAALCEYINKELEIEKERIYINFADIKGAMWGWKGSTF